MTSALEARACAIDEELMLCRLCRWQHERKFQGQDSGAPLEIAQQRVSIVAAIVQQNPQKARQASNAHLAYIEETLLNINQRDTRIQRVLRRIETNPS